MKYLRRTIWPFAVFALVVALTVFARHETLHFSTDRLVSALPQHPEWEFENPSEMESILSQPFHYFNKGGQSWVFLSEDGKWILKFFDFRLSWHDVAIKLHLPHTFTAKQLQSREGPVKAYALAFQRFKEPSGLVGAFLNGKKAGITSLKITSPIHCGHTIDLSHASFIIQKRAEKILPEQLNSLLKSGDTKGASAMLSKALTLIAARCAVGIADGDNWHLHRNIGFIGEEPIYLDAGTFRDDPALLIPQVAETEILRSADLLIEKISKSQNKS